MPIYMSNLQPISYALVGHSGDTFSRTFERTGGTVAQPTAGVPGTMLPSYSTVYKEVGPPTPTEWAPPVQPRTGKHRSR